jgi:hypothetical protein
MVVNSREGVTALEPTFLWLIFVANSRIGLSVGGLASGLVLGCFLCFGF